LSVRRAEAGISIEAGQARMLSNPTMERPDVDLALVGLINLVEGVVDARATLSASLGPPSPWPHVVLAVKGPIDSPERTLDVSALTSWLAARAIEQQSKKLDALEGRDSGSGTAAGAGGRRRAPAR
jgi:large subunit ribosomal protein L24